MAAKTIGSICHVRGCDKPMHSRLRCESHYRRYMRAQAEYERDASHLPTTPDNLKIALGQLAVMLLDASEQLQVIASRTAQTKNMLERLIQPRDASDVHAE